MSAPTTPTPERRVLDNGLTVIHQTNPHSTAVTMSLSLAAGAALEAPESEGLASLVAKALTRGTATRSKEDIGEALDFTGAHLGGSGGRHGAAVGAKAREADFESVAELLADVARNPTFPEREVSQLIGDRLTLLREEADRPRDVVARTFRELIYPADHPYARSPRGTEATVSSLQAENFRAFHARHYGPSSGLVVIVGGVEASRAFATVERFLGDWTDEATTAGYRAAQPRVPDHDGPSEDVRRIVSMPDKTQVELAVGRVGLRRDDPRYYAASLMNMILGRFAMGGRLGRSVREEQGMAYYTFSTLIAGLGAGPFVVRAGVQPGHVEPALSSIQDEMARMLREPVDEEELEAAKDAVVRSVPRALETNEGVAGTLHDIELYDLGADFLDRFPGIIRAVSRDDVAEAARAVLEPACYAVAIVGPYADAPVEGASAESASS